MDRIPARKEVALKIRVTSSVTRSSLDEAADQDRLYFIVGTLVGVICLAVGFWLAYAGLVDAASVELPLPGRSQSVSVHAAAVGAALAFIGVAVISIARPTVTR